MLRELDPCTSDLTLRLWGRRFGLVTDDLCAPQWSDDVPRALLCALQQIRGSVMTWDFLLSLAARFGASHNLRAAGDFSDCGPAGCWTMARDVIVMPDYPPPRYQQTAACRDLIAAGLGVG